MGVVELATAVEENASAGRPELSALFSKGVVGKILARHGSPEQRERWLGGIESGELQASFAITEPDAGEDRGGEVANMAKLLGSDAGTLALSRAIDACGLADLARFWFIVRTLQIGPVSREMILNFVSERMLGLPRSY